MLFNSFEFIFFFLPITLAVFYAASLLRGNELAIACLVACSLFFYSWWNPLYLTLLLFSMGVNFVIGRRLSTRPGRSLLTVGVVLNLGLLGYFKYTGFILSNIDSLFGEDWSSVNIILPLAISFFTFQQIAYLVDSYRGITREYSFLHYALFVSFFPQLIAGPIVHHKDVLPQFAQSQRFQPLASNIAIGLTIFAIGFFKKTVLADGVADYADPVFAAADAGGQPAMLQAWGGALAYTFQLYFDFSGYSDMAIGLARLFGIVLPLNFFSPYKACSIDEFWRRWHITLSNFLRDYVYIPLGGNRKGRFRRYNNLFITMVLGGIWHGAGWNFLIWGALHGGYLVTNQLWRRMSKNLGWDATAGRIRTGLAWAMTMLCVVIGWVFFRATTTDGAFNILYGMVGANGVELPNGILMRLGELGAHLQAAGVAPVHGGGSVMVSTWLWILPLSAVAFLLPNVQQLFAGVEGAMVKRAPEPGSGITLLPGLCERWRWTPSVWWACVSGVLFALGVLTLFQVSEFLYFQF
ncbi:MBOAT family O-acyltransferase [Chromatocurvus halotolerans]|uniref:Probable alginate O-acetylase n=1 Tax=Chromatocurvus halotolerans TaxID=1132028 RepID=A0A4R2KNX2_9GAMM|nr:MBOAT family protein [Chromatocurvus halotolerans]TCO74297.1 D-alanyl-lipoteichoic acid acyltransferase DltB (MBOAT superfamily) [Chromatocurvus halotolerans]